MRKLLALVSVVVLALVAVGCGSSGGSEGSPDDPTTTKAESTSTEAPGAGSTSEADPGAVTAEDYAAAFVINLSSGTKEDGDLVLAEDEAACVAPLFVEAITVEVLQDKKVTIDDLEKPSFDGAALGLSTDQGEQLIEAFATCDVDIVALFAESLTAGLTEEQQACAAENVDPDLTKALLIKTFSTGESDQEFEAVIADLTSKCDLPG